MGGDTRHRLISDYMARKTLDLLSRKLSEQPGGQTVLILGRDFGSLGIPILEEKGITVGSLQVNRGILLLLDCVFTRRPEAFQSLEHNLGNTNVEEYLNSLGLIFSVRDLEFFESEGMLPPTPVLANQLEPLLLALKNTLILSAPYSILDIGWNGTMQKCIDSISLKFDIQKPF